MNSIEKKEKMKSELKDLLRKNKFDHRTIGTRALIEVALEEAVIYKYQKTLLMAELTQRCTEGDFQN